MSRRLKRQFLLGLVFAVVAFGPRTNGVGMPFQWLELVSHGYPSWTPVDPSMRYYYILHGHPENTVNSILNLFYWEEFCIALDMNRSGGGPSIDLRPVVLGIDCVAAGLAVVLVRLWLVKRSRRVALRHGMCARCGYDLRGSPTGRCPECGVVSERASAKP
jgi:hypothetical protein